MKQTKRLLALVLSVVLLVGLMPAGALAEEIGASQSEELPKGGDAPVTPVEDVTPTEPEGTGVTEPPEVTEPDGTVEPPEETEPTEAAEPTDPSEPSGEPEETLPQDTEEDEFSLERFLEEYAAAGTYGLTEALTLTAGLWLDHPLVVQDGGSLTVPAGITLTIASVLTLDGGSVTVQSGGTLVLEAGGQIDVRRGLLKVAADGSFISNSDSPAISVTPGSGSVEGIALNVPATPEETEAPTKPELPEETEAPTEPEIPEETEAPTESDAALQIPMIRMQARVAGSGVQERIDLIRNAYPTDSYFTSTGQSHDTNSSACPAQPGSGMPYSTCACSLSQITAKPVSGLYSGAEVYQKIGKADRWQCKAFATYAFYNIFGRDVTSASCIRIDQTEPKLGDVISFNGQFLNGYHAGIYLGSNGSELIVYDANVDYYCKVRYGSIKSYDPATTYVYHAPNYDEINGAPSYDYSSIPSGIYYLENMASGKYLSVDNSGDGNGVNISVAERHISDGMRFQISDAADGYVMRPLCSSRIVNANGTAPGSGANIDLWNDLSDSSQWWKFEAVDGGYIIHSVFNSSCVLDTDGSNVRLAVRSGGASQIWTLKTQSEVEYQAPAIDDYRDWYNYDPRWADIPLGSGGSTVGAAGCLVNAATKLMIQAGLKSPDSCDVGTFVRWANGNSGFVSGTGNMYWGAVDRFCGFTNQGHLLEGSFSSSSYNDKIISWIRQGYHMVIGVNGNEHWVAVDEATSLRTGTVYIWDSYPDPTIRTGITLASRFSTFSTVHAWTGGSTPSPTPSYTLDLNGFLDGQQHTDISGYGTVDVYINGALTASGVSDYYTELPSGTTYEFRNITAASGHRYNGVHLGSLSGTIGSSSTEVVLSFSTVYNVTYRNGSGDTVKTVPRGEYTVEELYDKPDGSYFTGWAYQANATMFDVRPGETLTLSSDIVLYPVYISHSQATSGEVVLIYNINDFPEDGYAIAETTRDVSITTTQSDWSAWSEWSTAAVSGSDTVQVESRTAYGWYYFECPNCHAHMHGYGTCYTWCGGCGAATTAAGIRMTYDPTNWSTAQDWYGTTKYYAIINGERWFRWDDGGTQTQYRSRKLVTNTTVTSKTYLAYVIQPAVSPIETFTVTYHANGGSGAPASHSSKVVPEGWTVHQIPGQEVLEEKTQYRSRTKSTKTSTESSLPGWTLYDKSVSGYGEWSDWSSTPVTASETLEVKTKTVPAVTKTVWHYSRDTANGYSTYAIGYYGNPEYITLDYRLTAMGTIDGHTRYGSYGTTLSNYWWNEYSEEQIVQAAYTAYSSREIKYNYFYYRWSDWTEYSDTAITAKDGVEVQTRTVYRYAFGIKLSNTVPVRTGYAFQGWATTPSAATAIYQPGDMAAINANTTLYAVWKQDSYTVTYNANGGTGAPASQTKLYGTALTLSSTKPTRANTSADSFTVTLDAAGGTVSTNKLTAARTTGYFFQNWNTAANGSGVTYAPGASYTANAALTLYAQWSSNTTTASVTLPTPSRTGYTFQNWNTAANGTGTGYNAGAAYTPSGNVTLYAVWKLNQSVSGTLSLGASRGSAGSEVVLDVTLDKNPGIIALNFHFDYDKTELEFLGGEEGVLTGWTFSTSGNGALWDSDTDSFSTGTIAKLRFRILDNAEEDNVTIRLTDLMAGNRNEEEIFLATADGTITISNRIPGDMTDDGKVNIMDLIRLRKYLAGDEVAINLSNADVTGDGKVNVMDLIRLRKYLAGDDVELK